MRRLAICGLVTVVSTLSIAAPADQVMLGSRYIDRANGFSLRPPAGANRRTGGSPMRIVIWWDRDPARGAIAWTLSVLRAVEQPAPTHLGEYTKALAARLEKQENFLIEADRIISAAGKSAIDLRGTVKVANGRMWRRQVWIPQDGGKFIVLVITGSMGDRQRLDTLFGAVLETIDLSDTPSLLARRQDNLNRGKALLASLQPAKAQNVLYGEPRWFLFTYQGLEVGFMCVVESPQLRDGVEGFRIRTWTVLRLPSQPIRHAESEMFCSADFKTEQWTESLLLGAGPAAERLAEKVSRQDDAISGFLTRGANQRPCRKTIPAGMLQQYLPKPLGMILPRLVDLDKPEAYAFALYTPAQDDFDVRTFTVGAREEITVGTKRLQALRATDRPAEDAEEAVLWLDEKGGLLRMQTAEGCIMESAPLQEIAKRFPEAADIAKKATP